jgi:para-nitrobenzyl esterase
MDIVKLDSGRISGTLLEEASQVIHFYRGIPYAAPPVGDLRWKPPQPVAPWSGIRECIAYSLQPAQYPDINLPKKEQKVPSSEDCLYLNVLTPAEKASDKLPVMVWFHGGGLRYGSGNWPLYNSPGLPRNGVVLVTVNTRLGVLGLLPHPLLSRESPMGVSGNYLFHDMVASLKWVKRNITAFGGDPNNVTIFGESGGGMKVVSLIASPLAKGLFHRAICESGGTGSPATMQDLEKFSDRLFARLGVNKSKDPLAAAREIPWQIIIEVDQTLNMEMGEQMGPWFVFSGPWNLVVDGWYIPDTLPEIFRTGKQNTVPFILLSNLGELTGPGYVWKPEIIPDYINLLVGARKAKVKAYAGIFDQVPGNWRQEGGNSAHAMEMHFVFGAVDNPEPWNTLFFLYAAGGAKSPVPLISDAERKVSEIMMQVWTQFARTGDPNIPGMGTWPVWDKGTDQYLYIAEPLQVRPNYSKVACLETTK